MCPDPRSGLMSKRARRVSLFFETGQVTRLPDGFGRALASHLIGSPAHKGKNIHLPGWPTALVDLVEPEGATIGPGTRIELHAPPPVTRGALSLVVVADASLTMGKKREPGTRFEHTARLIDAVLLNGRSFIGQAGIVVQGGTTRETIPLQGPEELAGASILRVEPKGTFDMAQGLQQAVEMLDDAPQGPLAVLVMTDGSDVPKDDLSAVRPAMHAGAAVVALSIEPSERLQALCQPTGGLATTDPEEAFRKLAELAGTQADWTPPREPETTPDEKEDPYEFEVVIETIES